MRISYLSIIAIISISFFSCKQDAKSGAETAGAEQVASGAPAVAPEVAAAEKFESKALSDKGGQDLSKVYSLKQDQFIPDYDNGFNFKSKQALDIYAKGTNTNVDFTTSEAIGVFLAKTTKETIFKVESVNFDAADGPQIDISTTTTDKEVAAYRPSFIIAVPKDKIKGYPMVTVNKNMLPVTTIQ